MKRNSSTFDQIRLSSIIDASNDAFALVNPDGVVTDWSKNAERIYGYTKAEAIGKLIWNLAPGNQHHLVKEIIERIKKGEHLVRRELERKTNDGEILHISLNASPMIDPKGNLIGIIGLAHDITSRKKAQAEQERYHNFLENISDACFETDLKGLITYANRTAASISGFSQNEMIGIDYRNYTSREDARRIFNTFNEAYRTGESGIIRDYELYDRNGRSRFMDMAVSLIRDAAGIPAGFRVTGRDMTTRKQELAELERYRNFVESVEEGCFEMELNGRVTFANAAGARIIGYPLDKIIGLDSLRNTYPKDAKKITNIFQEIYKTGEPATINDYEIRYQNRDIRYLELFVSLIRDHQGKPVGYRGTFRDNTENKKAREELKLSEARYRNLFQYNKAVMLLIDPETGGIVDINLAACNYYGYTREEFLHKRITDINITTPEEVREAINNATQEKCSSFLFTHRLASGELHPVEVFTGPLEIGGKQLLYSIVHDITERRQAQEALSRSEEKYRTILSNMTDGYFELDPAGKFTFVNETACRILGYEQDELLQYDYRAFTTSETAKIVKEVFQQTFATGISNITDCEIISRDGNVYTHQLNVGLMKDADGNPIGFRVVSRDNTKRKQAEEALLLMQFSMDHAPESILLIDDLGSVTYANDAACTSMGYSREELKKLKVFDLDPDFPVDRWDKHKKDLQRLGKMTFEGRHRRKNGSLFPVEVTTNYLEYKGRFLGVAFDRDITERKQADEALHASEEKYRMILSNMTDGYFELDLSGTITFANDAGCAMMEGGHEQLLGQKAWLFITPQTRAYLVERYRKLIETASPDKMAEYEVTTCSGAIRVHQANAVLKMDASGNPSGINIVTRDITIRKREEEALRQNEERIRVLFNNIPVPTVVWKSRHDHLILAEYNDAALQYTGGRILEVAGKTIEECYPHAPHISVDANQCYSLRTNIEKSFWFHEDNAAEKRYVTIKYAFAPPDNVIMHINDITAQKKAEEHLKHISIHDALTGLYNRFYSDAEIARISASRIRPVSFIVVDLNNLKTINDKHGHAAGDLYIKNAATLLRQTFRPEDMIARIGGDEFIAMLPSVDENTCAQLFIRLKKNMVQFNRTIHQPISLSAGFSTAHAGDNIEARIAEADRLMYHEKARMKVAMPR